jgi:hypothetical protein
VATLCLLPFLNKPFLIDDPYFLAMAQQIIEHPASPMNFDTCWNVGPDCTKAYMLTPGNTLFGYLLVPIVLSGSREWMAHIMQMFLACLAVIAMASLTLRLGWGRSEATTGTLLLVALPPLLPMASTAMPDVLAAAISFVAIDRLAAWKASARWYDGLAAGVALGLAGIARAHLAVLIPLGAFLLFETAKPELMLLQLRKRLWFWTPVLIGGCVLLAIIYATRERGLALDPPSAFAGAENIPRNLTAYLIYLCFPLPLAVYWIAARGVTLPRALLLLITVAAGMGVLLRSLAIALGIIGLFVLGAVVLEGLRKRDHRDLFLVFWLLVPLPIVYYGHLPIKYLLPCVPAIILICFRLSEKLPVRTARAFSTFLIGAGTLYSCMILRSDAELANFGRSAMDRLIRPRIAAGEKVWFASQFSAYWYAPLAGAELTDGTRRPRAGDLLVVGALEGEGRILEKFPNRRLVERLRHTYSFGRTMGSGTGLYTNRQGFWLWGFGTSEQDRYDLWRITKDLSRAADNE